MDLFELLQNTTVWVTISFVLFCVLVFNQARRGITSTLDKNIDEIKAEIEQAENLRVEAQELLAQFQRKHKDAQKDAKEIIELAKKQAEENLRNAMHEADETIALREEQLGERLQRIEEKAISDIRSQVTEVATIATLEIISSKLGKAENEKLISETIKALPENIKKAS